MSLHSLPLFVRLAGRPVILVGEGDAAEAKRRLLERAGAAVVGEGDTAALGVVALEEPDATVARLKARGVLVNAVDRPDLCDFTLPAIVDRDPVIVAISTGGVSAGLAAALRQRLETLLPAGLGALAHRLHAMRAELRATYPDAAGRRRAIAAMLADGGEMDLLRQLGPGTESSTPQGSETVKSWTPDQVRGDGAISIRLVSSDPDDLTLRQARLLANADRVTHGRDVPAAILDRARADATRVPTDVPPVAPAAGSVDVRMA